MLQGIELIDCAKANARKGVAFAAKQCGYDDNTVLFKQDLQQACQQIGVSIDDLKDLITDQQLVKENINFIEVSPDSATEL